MAQKFKPLITDYGSYESAKEFALAAKAIARQQQPELNGAELHRIYQQHYQNFKYHTDTAFAAKAKQQMSSGIKHDWRARAIAAEAEVAKLKDEQNSLLMVMMALCLK